VEAEAMRVLTMSDTELDKLEIIRDVDLERIPARAAAVVLGISNPSLFALRRFNTRSDTFISSPV
jgi:hypothetical protein